MDYEQRWKNVLKWARGIYPNAEGAYKEALEHFFPELKESEDERIRKEIIDFLWKEKIFLQEAHSSVKNNPKYRFVMDAIAWLEKQGEPIDKGEISDGYHTFNELYYYRMLYNAAFFNMLPKEWVHKSKRHHDGEECFGGGWFIVMANLPTGQISNHYELKDWELFQIPEKEVADEWDGHTPQEAAERLHKYLSKKQGEQKPADTEKGANGNDREITNSIADKLKEEYRKGWDAAMHQLPKEVDSQIWQIANDAAKTWEESFAILCATQKAYDRGKKDASKEQKPAWSEEDEHLLGETIQHLEELIRIERVKNCRVDVKYYQRNIAWLKSIKQRLGGGK